jgi:hypothetical protein
MRAEIPSTICQPLATIYHPPFAIKHSIQPSYRESGSLPDLDRIWPTGPFHRLGHHHLCCHRLRRRHQPVSSRDVHPWDCCDIYDRAHTYLIACFFPAAHSVSNEGNSVFPLLLALFLGPHNLSATRCNQLPRCHAMPVSHARRRCV